MGTAVLIIAEKPSVARDLARALIGFNADKGNLFRGKGPSGEDVTITSAAGHLFELEAPEFYSKIHGKDFGKWIPQDLPALPAPGWVFSERLVQVKVNGKVDAEKSRYYEATFKQIAAEAARHSGQEIVNACDPEREGELIFRRLISHCQFHSNTTKQSRMRFTSMTDDSLREAYEKRIPSSKLDNLALAGHTRAQADWLVGMNKTILASKTLPRGHGLWKVWSIGRVQTPTLALVVDRDRKIENFQPQPFWDVLAHFQGAEAKADLSQLHSSAERDALLGVPEVVEDRSKKTFWSKDAAQKFASSAKNGPRYIPSDTKTTTSTRPKLPFNLGDAMKYCAKRFEFNSDKTLSILQSLYEKHKVLTYPRTDSQHFNEDMKEKVYAATSAVHRWLQSAMPDLHMSKVPLVSKEIAFKSRAFDDSQVSDHFALAPTGNVATLANLDRDERLVFLSVVQAVLVCLDEPAKYEELTRRWKQITGAAPYFPAEFVATRKKLVYPGWTRWDRPKAAASQDALPSLIPGAEVLIDDVVLKQGKTSAPEVYTDATLLTAMELAGTGLADAELSDPAKRDELIRLMKDKGIGTQATRSSIIKTLITRCYIERKGVKLRATPNGCALIQHLRDIDPISVSAAQTAEWEYVLKLMEKGQSPKTREQFLDGILEQFMSVKDVFISKSTRAAVGGTPFTEGQPVLDAVCPVSGKPLKDRGPLFESEAFEGIGLWKKAFGKEWTAQDYVKLLDGVKKKSPIVFEGLVAKSGTVYSAPLTIDKAKRCVVIHTVEEKLKGINCPKTKKPVVDHGKYWILPGWPKLRLYKTWMGREWTIEAYLQTIEASLKGEPIEHTGLVGTKGTPFSAKVLIGDENATRLDLQFGPRAA